MSPATKYISAFSFSLFAFVAAASPALAIDAPAASPSRGVPPISLPTSKLQSCLARESAIVTRSSSLTRMATNMLDVFASIAGRVEDYYVSSGKTVANYSQLVESVAANKNLVQTALTAASNDVAGFSCTSNDPKGHMLLFLKDMKAVKTALKNYRTSIKNLIVAVRSVTAGADASESPKPSLSPSPRASSIPGLTRSPNPKSQGR